VGILVACARCQPLGDAALDLAVLNKSLDEPVILARAKFAAVDARLADVIVSTLTPAAVEVFIFQDFVTLVAVDGPCGLGFDHFNDRLVAESQLLRFYLY